MIYPEKLVIDAVLARLSDPLEGFNATFNDNAATFDGVAANMAIDFTSAPSKNFVLGDVDPSDFEQTSPFTYPMLTLFATRVRNTNRVKFNTFSGIVTCGFNVFVTWRNNNVKRDFESYAHAVTSTGLWIMNRARLSEPSDQDWGLNVVYNGDVEVVRSAVKPGKDNWFKQIGFQMTFEVDQES